MLGSATLVIPPPGTSHPAYVVRWVILGIKRAPGIGLAWLAMPLCCTVLSGTHLSTSLLHAVIVLLRYTIIADLHSPSQSDYNFVWFFVEFRKPTIQPSCHLSSLSRPYLSRFRVLKTGSIDDVLYPSISPSEPRNLENKQPRIPTTVLRRGRRRRGLAVHLALTFSACNCIRRHFQLMNLRLNTLVDLPVPAVCHKQQ